MIAEEGKKVQESLGKEETGIIIEEVDDFVLLIAYMERIGLRKILDKHIPVHWKQRELSWGVDSSDLAGLYNFRG